MKTTKLAVFATIFVFMSLIPATSALATTRVKPLYLPKLTEMTRTWTIYPAKAADGTVLRGVVMRGRASSKYILFVKYQDGRIVRVVAGERNRTARAVCMVSLNSLEYCKWNNEAYGTAEEAKWYVHSAYRYFLALRQPSGTSSNYIKMPSLPRIISSWSISRRKPETNTIIKTGKSKTYHFAVNITNGSIWYVVAQSTLGNRNIVGCKVSRNTAYACKWLKTHNQSANPALLMQYAYRELVRARLPSTLSGINSAVYNWRVIKTSNNGNLQAREYRIGKNRFIAVINQGRLYTVMVEKNAGSRVFAICNISGSSLYGCKWKGINASSSSAQIFVYLTYVSIPK